MKGPASQYNAPANLALIGVNLILLFVVLLWNLFQVMNAEFRIVPHWNDDLTEVNSQATYCPVRLKRVFGSHP